MNTPGALQNARLPEFATARRIAQLSVLCFDEDVPPCRITPLSRALMLKSSYCVKSFSLPKFFENVCRLSVGALALFGLMSRKPHTV